MYWYSYHHLAWRHGVVSSLESSRQSRTKKKLEEIRSQVLIQAPKSHHSSIQISIQVPKAKAQSKHPKPKEPQTHHTLNIQKPMVHHNIHGIRIKSNTLPTLSLPPRLPPLLRPREMKHRNKKETITIVRDTRKCNIPGHKRAQ